METTLEYLTMYPKRSTYPHSFLNDQDNLKFVEQTKNPKKHDRDMDELMIKLQNISIYKKEIYLLNMKMTYVVNDEGNSPIENLCNCT